MQQEHVPRIAATKPGFRREDKGDSNNEEEEWKDEIGGRPAIPLGVFEGPVRMVVSGVVDQDHGGDGDAAEQIERSEAGRGA